MSYWVFDWLNENSIKTPDDVDRVLRSSSLYGSLRDAATRSSTHDAHKVHFENVIVAGRGLDLTGIDAPSSRAAIVRQTMDLLRRAWHYFDLIIVSDYSPVISATPLRYLNRSAFAGWLESLLLIKATGAEDLFMFMAVHNLCEDCGKISGRDMFSDKDESIDRSMVELLESNSEIIGKRFVDGTAAIHIRSDEYYFDYTATIDKNLLAGKSDAAILRELLWPAVGQCLDRFSMDVFFANVVGRALASSAPIENWLLQKACAVDGDSANRIAFSIEMPLLEGIPLSSLFKVRSHEREAFATYQAALRQAIHERVKAATASSPEKVAEEIYRDVIEKPLLDLRLRLRRNGELLQKEWASVMVGAALGVVGLLTHQGPLITAGFGGAFGLTAAALSAYKERKELESRDTFFLLNPMRNV